MNKFSFALLLICIISFRLNAQILPIEGSKLTYRLIGFSFPTEPQAIKYIVEIAKGHFVTEDLFNSKIVIRLSSDTNRLIAELPSFGTQYTWRTVYNYKHASSRKSEFHHFNTGIGPNVDSNAVRLRILKNTGKYKDAYVFLDANWTLYDMRGQPIWYLPKIDELDYGTKLIRDLKITTRGTITFLIDEINAYEINYNGNVLWKAPNNGIVSGDSIEHYHHEFTRLSDGHYMLLGNEIAFWMPPSPQDSSLVIVSSYDALRNNTNARYRKVLMGTIIEYDEKGNAIWSWKSSTYFNGSDLFNHRRQDGSVIIHAHENSFFFDSISETVYLSFRDIDRVIKIKYPDGYVMNTFGEIYKPGISEKENYLFCRQHSCKISQKGYLYLFDNNVCNSPSLPKILMLQEPLSENDSLKIIWEYQCTSDGMDEKINNNSMFTSGGNVIELPDKSIFASMSAPYNKLFIVNLNKQILWSAVSEKWYPYEKKWYPSPTYRASIITSRKDMEQLIWNAEKEQEK